MSITSPQRAEYDYIVVGGGTAGCAIASRVAADTSLSVALVEAGAGRSRLLGVPLIGLWLWLRFPRAFCWQDWTIPQAALGGRRIWWPAGRGVGGSSAINAMICSRGAPASYDRWRAEAGPAWCWDALLPYFRRAETHERGATPLHGGSGPIGVSESRHRSALGDSFVAGCETLGIPRTDDFSGASSEGAGYFQLFQDEGMRASAARYLTRTPGGPRVTLHLRSPVRRIVLERTRAVGVEIGSGSRARLLLARREVVLCAGTLRSPGILLHSGIGPADALRRLDIPPLVDLPGVGRNLRDHVRVPVVFRREGPRPGSFLALVRALADFLGHRRGLLTSNVCDAGAVVRLDTEELVPSIRIVCQWRTERRDPHHLVNFEVVLIDPASRGSLALQSSEPRQPIAIDPAYLSDPGDLERLRRGIDLAREIAASPPCRSAGLGAEHLPGTLSSEAHIRRRLDSAYHPVGTCRLGVDSLAVVDPSLRVRGIDGLRIADASVLPTTVAGNAQAAVLAIAERAADLILER